MAKLVSSALQRVIKFGCWVWLTKTKPGIKNIQKNNGLFILSMSALCFAHNVIIKLIYRTVLFEVFGDTSFNDRTLEVIYFVMYFVY